MKEAFGELNVPLIKDLPLIKELTIDGSGRVSDYKGAVGTVYTYSGGGNYKPIQDITVPRCLFAVGACALSRRSVLHREPELRHGHRSLLEPQPRQRHDLSRRELQRGRKAGSLRLCLCSSLQIVSGGNPNLQAETSHSLTAGVVLTPRYVPGLTLSLDYYNITVNNVITAVAAQNILNLCYDSPTLANPFCGLFQRASAAGGPGGEQQFRVIEGSLLQSSANFAKLKARGLDLNLDYAHRFGFGFVSLKGAWTHVIQRDNFTNPALPAFQGCHHQRTGRSAGYVQRQRGCQGRQVQRRLRLSVDRTAISQRL